MIALTWRGKLTATAAVTDEPNERPTMIGGSSRWFSINLVDSKNSVFFNKIWCDIVPALTGTRYAMNK
mgnify:FL=1